MGRRTQAVGVACGLGGLAAFLAAWGVAAVGDPDYSPFASWISDLGVGPMASVFNAGVVAAGVGIAVFAALGLRPVLGKGAPAVVAVCLFCLVGALAVLVGVYTLDDEDAHVAASNSLFFALPFAGFATWVALRRGDPLGRTVTELTKGTAVLLLILLVFLFNLNDKVAPVAETLVVMAMVPWFLVVLVELGQRIWRPAGPAPASSADPQSGPTRRNADDAAPP